MLISSAMQQVSELVEFLTILFDVLVVVIILPILFSYAQRLRDLEKESYLVVNLLKLHKNDNK